VQEHLMPEPYRVVSALPTGTAFARFLMVKATARGDTLRELQIAERFKDSPTVHATLELITKAAVSPATTTDGTWAGPLAQYGVAGEALQLLRGASIIGALEPKMRRVPFRVKVPREIGAGTGGGWIGQGLGTPVTATAYDVLQQEAYKAGKIVVLSRELLQLGDPVAEKTVRDTVIAGVTAYLDAQFLTNTVTLAADVRPAAITNGATAVTSTGTTAAQITADLNGLLAAINTTGTSLVWVMRPLTVARMAATLGNAVTGLPTNLFGIPVVLSANSPQQITLIDAAHILYSDDGSIDVDTSESAAIEMDSVPTDPPTAATVTVSLFHRNLFGIKVIRWLSYLRAQTGAVATW
jgi:HK97 family phage major capsid protein